MYGDRLNPRETSRFQSTIILAAKNVDCDAINEEIIDKIDVDVVVYRSVDTRDDDCIGNPLFSIGFLNTLQVTGIPPHLLKLRVGYKVMLLRNLNVKQDICNGVRMVVRKLQQYVLEVQLLTSTFAGTTTSIPRIDLHPTQTQLPIPFTRRQIFVPPAFAMTINKVQGQTFEKIGLWLEKPVFTHGQLYAALSRMRNKASLHVQLLDGCTTTTNVVYREALTSCAHLPCRRGETHMHGTPADVVQDYNAHDASTQYLFGNEAEADGLPFDD